MKWTFIRGKKPSAIAAAVLTVMVFVVALTVIVTAAVLLTATGCTWAAMRRKSRRKHSLSNLYMLPERGLDFTSGAGNLKTGTEN